MGGKSEGGSGQREGGAKDLEEGTKVVGGCCGFAARVQKRLVVSLLLGWLWATTHVPPSTDFAGATTLALLFTLIR
ncbi:hypothetical protein DPV78_001579 [Talaromyces pinophilus]|nr:hypothetical protein DPV78_001579 [Talaromyces pinophilus]